MRKILCVSALVAASVALNGCGWLFGDKGMFRDRGDDYRRATVEKPLEIPPGLSKSSIEDEAAIPPVSNSASLEGRFVVPRPEPLEGNPDAEQVKIQKLGANSWILVDASPGEVWPRVRQFLATNQLTVMRADANAGIIETGFLQPRSEGAQRERYRFRIEQGVQRGSSEVYVLQANAGANDSNWPTASSNHEREDEMVKALAQFIADNGSTGAVSMLAQRNIDSRGKVFLNKKPGEKPYLLLELPFERAWASLSTALPKAGFTIDDLNRDQREFQVHYEPPKELEEEKGWWRSFWSWVFGEKEENIHKDVPYVVRVEPAPLPAAKPGTAEDGAVQITVTRQDGKPLSNGVTEQLLNFIKGKVA